MKPRIHLFPSLAAIPFLWASSLVASTDPIEDLPSYAVESHSILPRFVITPESGAMALLREEDWSRLGAADLAGALRRVPGVTVSRYNIVGSYGGADGGAVFVRGHGSSRPGSDISILLDGIPRVVGVWSHPLLDTLSIDTAAAITVFKSPQPVMLGNMAFGAINLLPKRQEPRAASGIVRASTGSWQTHRFSAQGGWADDQLDVLLSATYRESQGHRPNASGDTQAWFLNSGWKATESFELRYLLQYSRSNADDPEPEGIPLPIVENYRTSNAFHLIKAVLDTPVFQTEAKLYLEQGTADWLQWHSPPPAPFPAQELNTRTDSLNSGLHLNLKPNRESPLQWRGGLHYDRVGGAATEDFAVAPDNRFDSVSLESIAPYLHASTSFELSPEHLITLGGGARFSHHSVFGNETGWQLNAQYATGELTLATQYARAINFPGVFVSVFGRRPAPWGVGDSWKDLRAETVDAWELSTRWQPAPGFTFHISLFHHDVSDALRIISPPPVGYIQNLDSYDLYGLEAGLMSHLASSLHLSLSATWMESSGPRPNIPQWNLQSGLIWTPSPLWELSLGLQHTSSQLVLNPRFGQQPVSVDGFTLLDASLRYQLPNSWFQHLSVFASAENLTNTTYAYRPGYPMPKFHASAGFEIRW